MASVNKVILVGNLGRDPESRYLPSGEQVASISVATTDVRKDRQTGERVENTEWHRVAFFGKLAEIASQYLRKGSQVYIEGRLRTRKYTGKDGIERYATEILADQMQMLGARQGGANAAASYEGGAPAPQQRPVAQNYERQPQAQGAGAPPNIAVDDDIPF